jgi:hypothetical protein
MLARGRVRGLFVGWLALIAVSFAFPSQLGENAARLRFMALPLALLVLRGRPLVLAVPLAVVAAVYNVSPLAWSFEKGLDERGESAAYWTPAIKFLHARADANFRVNALDTVGHWEAFHLPSPTAIVPGANVTRLTHDSLTLEAPRPGRYVVRVREGAGWRVWDAPGAGTFTLDFP